MDTLVRTPMKEIKCSESMIVRDGTLRFTAALLRMEGRDFSELSEEEKQSVVNILLPDGEHAQTYLSAFDHAESLFLAAEAFRSVSSLSESVKE